MERSLTFLDLFAGAGGLSEGFIRTGYSPVGHVEMDVAACYTLKTRMAFHWLNNNGKLNIYNDYVNGKITRSELYDSVPPSCIDSVINAEINDESLPFLFDQIDELLGDQDLDLIVGGPPCQAYSLVGRARDSKRMKGDKRNYLFVYYAEFLKRYKPRYFVFENVTGLLSAKSAEGISYLKTMSDLFEENGYKTKFEVLSANEYGVLQKRKRIILVGRRGDITDFYPSPDKWDPDVKVNEIFKDLPELKAGEGSISPCSINCYDGSYLYDANIKNDNVPMTFHQARGHRSEDLEIYKIAVDKWNEGQRLSYNYIPTNLKSHKNRSAFLDRFKVVEGEMECSHTVVAHIAKDGHYYIHPDIKQNRSLTPREAARLQTFPDDYYFESKSGKAARTPAFRQIGNAVPVLLAQKIAEKLKEVWRD